MIIFTEHAKMAFLSKVSEFGGLPGIKNPPRQAAPVSMPQPKVAPAIEPKPLKIAPTEPEMI